MSLIQLNKYVQNICFAQELNAGIETEVLSRYILIGEVPSVKEFNFLTNANKLV